MPTLSEWEKQYRKPNVSGQEARASQLPHHSGDGYAWGGGAVVTIGERAIVIGEGDGAFEIAREIARRWNHIANVCDHDFASAVMLPEGGAQATCKACGFVAKSNL